MEEDDLRGRGRSSAPLPTVLGADMGFRTAGAVTGPPAAMAVFALVHRPIFLCHLTLALTGSLATGLGYQPLVAT